MKKIRNKRVMKINAGKLKGLLKDADDEKDVVLTFMMKDKGIESVYLAEVYTHMRYDPVIKEDLHESEIVELIGFIDEYCTYVEDKDDTV